MADFQQLLEKKSLLNKQCWANDIPTQKNETRFCTYLVQKSV